MLKAVWLLAAAASFRALAQPSVPMAPLPAGVVLQDAKTTSSPALSSGRHVILRASAELSSGDLDRVSNMVRRYVTLFQIVYMADIQVTPDGPVLRDVQLGFARQFAGRWVTVTTESRDPASADLGFIERQILSANEDAIARVKILGRHPRALWFEAPTLMNGPNGHGEVPVRFLVAIDRTGSLRTAVWQLRSQSSPVVDGQRLVLLPHELHEIRRMHVDGGEFTLGMPSPRAFALEAMPPGTDFPLADAQAVAFASSQIAIEELLQVLDW